MPGQTRYSKLVAPTAGLLTITLTVAAYFAFVEPDDRGQAFYVAIVTSCFAELIFFAFVYFALGELKTNRKTDPAINIRLGTFIAVWLLGVLIAGPIASNPAFLDSFLSQHLLILNLIAALVVFSGVAFQYRQATAIADRNDLPQLQRRKIEAEASRMDALLERIRGLSSTHPQLSVEISALAKRIDTIRTQLLSSGSSVALPKPSNKSLTDEELESRLVALEQAIADTLSGQAEEKTRLLADARINADAMIHLLRQREDALTF